MFEGENLALQFTVHGHDLSHSKVVAVFENGNRRLEKTNDDMMITSYEGGSLVTLRLAQKDTLVLGMGMVTVQFNWITQDGLRRATKKATFNVESNLYKKVMQFEDL